MVLWRFAFILKRLLIKQKLSKFRIQIQKTLPGSFCHGTFFPGLGWNPLLHQAVSIGYRYQSNRILKPIVQLFTEQPAHSREVGACLMFWDARTRKRFYRKFTSVFKMQSHIIFTQLKYYNAVEIKMVCVNVSSFTVFWYISYNR